MAGSCGVGGAAGEVDVGGVVGADGGGDVGVFEEAFLERELVAGGGGHQHDVDQALAGVLADLVAVFGQGAEADLASGVGLGRQAGCADAEGHVGVLGVGEDEVAAALGVGVDGGEFLVEGFRLARVGFP